MKLKKSFFRSIDFLLASISVRQGTMRSRPMMLMPKDAYDMSEDVKEVSEDAKDASRKAKDRSHRTEKTFF